MDESVAKVNPQMSTGYYSSFQKSLSQQLLHNSLLRVGIVIETFCSSQESAVIHAIGSPISNCCVTSLIIIKGEETSERDARDWLEHCRVTLTPDKVRIMYGHKGYKSILENATLV